MVVADQHPLDGCPHLEPEVVARCNLELEAQYAAGKWTKRDLAEDALAWAKGTFCLHEKSPICPPRIGGQLVETITGQALKLPYFNGHVIIHEGDIVSANGNELTRWEKVFIYNHLSQGGSRMPVGKWKGFEEFPNNTVSKIKTMAGQVEAPLVDRFQRASSGIDRRSTHKIGATDMTGKENSADAAFLFHPFSRVPVMLLFWDEDPTDGFGATTKLLFDETVIEHLDIESIVFLSERLRQLLCDAADNS